MAKDEKRIDGFLGILTSTKEPEEAETRAEDASADVAGSGDIEEEKPRSGKSKKTGSRRAPAREHASRSTERTRSVAPAKDAGAAHTSTNEPAAEPAPEARSGEDLQAGGPVGAASIPGVSPATDLTGQLLHVPHREQLPLRVPKNHRFPADVYEKIEAIVYWERLPSNTQFIVNACQAAIEALEAARGKPYPPKPS